MSLYVDSSAFLERYVEERLSVDCDRILRSDPLDHGAAHLGGGRPPHGARTLDALHLAAAQRVAGPDLAFVTYDVGQAQAARALRFPVSGS